MYRKKCIIDLLLVFKLSLLARSRIPTYCKLLIDTCTSSVINDVNESNPDNELFHSACRGGQLDAVKFLLGRLPIHKAKAFFAS